MDAKGLGKRKMQLRGGKRKNAGRKSAFNGCHLVTCHLLPGKLTGLHVTCLAWLLLNVITYNFNIYVNMC